MWSWLVVSSFSYSSFRRSCLWCFSVFISAISSKWRNNIKSSWVMCCFLWHIALKLPCSPATQLVVTPGAWWLEDLSGCRMAQKTTRGFAPISKVLYAFVLNLFEYNGIINTSYTHTFTSCWSTIIFAKAQTHTHTQTHPPTHAHTHKKKTNEIKKKKNSHITDKPVALEFPIKLEFRNLDFCGGRKIREARENLSEQGREPSTSSAHLWHRV